MSRRHGSSRRNNSGRYYVQTTGGNVLYNGDEIVTVQVASQSFLEKRVKDLNTGETVVWDVRETRKTIEDVEPYFDRSPLYARARSFVYTYNSGGEQIPHFRGTLMRALADRGIVDSESLEAKIMYEPTGETNVPNMFSGAEYKQGAEYIKSLLDHSRDPERWNLNIPEASTIEDWLRGQTKAPGDHRIFRVLNREFGGNFESFISTPEDPNGFYRNYWIWRVIRQKVMETLNSWSGTPKGEEPREYERQEGIDTSAETQLIRQHFLGDITPELKSVMITDIDEISGRRNYDITRTDRSLGVGIVRGRVPELRNNLISWRSLMDDYSALTGYVINTILSSTDLSCFAPVVRSQLYSLFVPEILKRFGEDLDEELKVIDEKRYDAIIHRETKETLESITIERVVDGLFGAGVERSTGYPREDLLRLFESFFKVRRTIPKKVWDYKVGIMRKLQRSQIDILRAEIEKEYGYDFERGSVSLNKGSQFITTLLLDEFAKHSALSVPEIRQAVSRAPWDTAHIGEYYLYYLLNNNRDLLERFIGQNRKVCLFTRDYTRDILSRYGLENLLNMKQVDFMLEDLGIPFRKPPRNL